VAFFLCHRFSLDNSDNKLSLGFTVEKTTGKRLPEAR
jgi:hypothetical protein